MQPVTLSSEVLQSVSAARKCALESRYDAALQLYATADAAIEASLRTLDDNAICTDLALLQTKLAEEADLAREIHGELRAMVDPATAVRRDRGDASMPQSTRQGMHSSPKFNNTDDGNRSRVVKRSPTQQDPISALNQKWYGDKDRFGPPDGPIIPSPSLLSKRSTSARCAAPARRYASVPTSRPIVSTRRTVPKTGECGSQAAVQERRSKKGSGPVRFTGRAGEEELVQLIEADMHTGALPVTWDDIAGVKEAKHLLEEAVVYPVLMPNYYQGIRRPWKGVLMYGPPGTGKTMLAKAVASECGTTFFNISPATLTSKWRGESEKLIRVLFEMARHYAPSTIFIDEIDSLCGQRGGGEEHEASRRAKGTLLAQMDGVGVDQGKIVMVLGATNHPWDIDEAMRRRLEKRIYIPLPDYADRVELFKINTASLKLSSDVDFEKLSRVLDGHYYSGADITNIVRDAAMMTMRRYMHEADKTMLKEHAAEIGRRVAEQPTTMDDFMCAIKKVPSSINVENINKFEKWKKEFELNI